MIGKTDENLEDIDVAKKYEPPKTMPSDATIANIPEKVNGHQTSSTMLSEEELDRAVDLDELEERVMSLMEKGDNLLPNNRKRRGDICKVCGKEGETTQIKKHIEANHLEGIVIPCNVCKKTFRSRDSLRQHIKRRHQKQSVSHLQCKTCHETINTQF